MPIKFIWRKFFSKTFKYHLGNMEDVLGALKTEGVTLKLSKCDFLTDRIKQLVHIILPGIIQVEKEATKFLRNVRSPQTHIKHTSFLVLRNYFRRFVWNYSDISLLLYALTQINPIVQWCADKSAPRADTDRHWTAAFRISESYLPYSIDTDAHKYQIEWDLFQIHTKNEGNPTRFWYQKINKAENIYSLWRRAD